MIAALIGLSILVGLGTVGDSLEGFFSMLGCDWYGGQCGGGGDWDQWGYPNHGAIVGTCPDACGWHGASYTATPFSPEEYSWTYPDPTPIPAHDGGTWTYNGPTWFDNGDWRSTWRYNAP